VVCENQVVVDRHAPELSGFDELPRDADVLAARLWISRRMVMRYNDSGRVRKDSRLEDLSGLDDRRGQPTHRGARESDERAGRIQKADQELFPVAILEVGR